MLRHGHSIHRDGETTGRNITATASYNVLISRQGPNEYNPAAAAVWIQANLGTVIPSVTVINNYIDNSGLYYPVYVYPPDSGPGYIGSGTCTGNKSLTTGATLTSNSFSQGS